jgi:hypothetical protein
MAIRFTALIPQRPQSQRGLYTSRHHSHANGNKRQRPNPRPDLKRGRDDDGRASAGGATPGHTELIEENKRRLKALSQRYPGQLEQWSCVRP